MMLTVQPSGETTLTGPIADKAALLGLLNLYVTWA
jgi:hypothetical protein